MRMYLDLTPAQDMSTDNRQTADDGQTIGFYVAAAMGALMAED